MNARSGFSLLAATAALLAFLPSVHARVLADVAAPDARRVVLAQAEALAHPKAPAPLPANLATPFSPQDFAQPDPSEVNQPAVGNASNAAPVKLSDRALLATVADKIPTTGTIILNGTPLLICGVNRIEVGSHFTVVYEGQEYELELVAVDPTTFTVRYRGEEYTRPIKLAPSK